MIVNSRTSKFDVYIGRKDGAKHFGNPFTSRKSQYKDVMVVPSREAAVQCHRDWLLGNDFFDLGQSRRVWIFRNLELLRDKVMGCYCDWPQEACHGQNYLELLKACPNWNDINNVEEFLERLRT